MIGVLIVPRDHCIWMVELISNSLSIFFFAFSSFFETILVQQVYVQEQKQAVPDHGILWSVKADIICIILR